MAIARRPVKSHSKWHDVNAVSDEIRFAAVSTQPHLRLSHVSDCSWRRMLLLSLNGSTALHRAGSPRPRLRGAIPLGL